MNFFESAGAILAIAGIICGVWLSASLVEALLGSASLFWWTLGFSVSGAILMAAGENW